MIPRSVTNHPAFRRGYNSGYNAGRKKSLGTGPQEANLYLFTYRATDGGRIKELIVADNQEQADQCFFKRHPLLSIGEANSLFVDICSVA